MKALRLPLRAVAAVMLSVFVSGAAYAETLRIAHHHAVGGMMDRSAHVFAEEAARLSDGELQVQVFPAAQLGQQQEAYDQLDLGIIDMTLTPSSLLDKNWAAIRHADLPFLWDSFEHFERAKNGEWGQAMVEHMLANSNTRILGLAGFGFRDMVFRGEPVTDIAGLSGMKMRAPESRLWIRMFELLGARPTPVTWGEVYTAMQTGVAEGLESPPVSALDMKFDEVTNSVVLTQHMFGINTILINERRFQSLSPELQEVVLEAGRIAADFFDRETKAQSISAYEEMQAKGMTVVEPKDRSEWVAAMQPLWDEVRNDHSDSGKLIDMVLAAK